MMLPKGSRVPIGSAKPNEVLDGKTFMGGGSFAQKTGTIPNFAGTTPFQVPWTGGYPEQVRVQLPTGYFEASNPLNQVFLHDENYKGDNIAAGKQVLGMSGTFTADANATAEDIAKDKTAYVNGQKITGTATAQAFTPIEQTIQTNAQSFGQNGDNFVLTFSSTMGNFGPNLLGVVVKFVNADASWEYEDGKSLDLSSMTFTAFKMAGHLVAHEQQINLGTASLSSHFGEADLQNGIYFDIVFTPSAGTLAINDSNPLISVDVWSY